MATPDVENFLAHYGVPGMKWGRRRSDAQLAKARESRSSDANEAYEAKAKAKKSGVGSLSNNELQKVNTRMNLERQYKDLTTKDKTTGMQYVDRTIKAGKKANEIYKLANSPLVKDSVNAGKAAVKQARNS